MKEQVLATYTRKSTLWAHANAFYKAQDWTKMECIVVDYTEEIQFARSGEMRLMKNGEDVTEQELERWISKCYGRPYVISFYTDNRPTVAGKSYSFETKEEANEFFKQVMNDKILGNFKKAR